MPKDEFPGTPPPQPDRAGPNGGDNDDDIDVVLEWMDQHVSAGTRSDLPTDSQVSATGLSGIGAPLSGLVAKNFLEVHRIAQRQLNFYFVEPLVTNYLLNAERIMEKTKEDHDQLVEALLEAARANVTLGRGVTVAEPADGTKDSAGGRNARMTQAG